MSDGDTPPARLVDIMHEGAVGCRGVAFRYTEHPVRGTVIDPQKVRLLDGTIPVAGSLMICGTCGACPSYADLVPAGSW